MRRRDADLESDTQRPRLRYPPSASLTAGGRGEGGRGDVLPERLKSGSGHHRLEMCGPSNGHHKLA